METSRVIETELPEELDLNTADYVFRHEFYGGLVHSRRDGARFELDHAHAAFFEAIAVGATSAQATEAVQLVIPGAIDFSPDIQAAMTNSFITPGAANRRFNLSSKELARLLDQNHVEATTRDYLRAPINLSVYPFMGCQLNCEFCYVTDEKWVKGSHDASDWITVMRQAKAAGTPFVSFLGGDPLLYRGITDLIWACDSVGIKGTVTTNGLAASDKVVEAIVGTRNITPVVSLQSLDDLHQKLTGQGYEASVATVDRLQAAGKNCNVNLVYCEQSLEQVLAVVDYCARVGVNKFTIAVFANIKNVSLRVPSFSEYRRLHEYVTDYIADKGYRLDFQTEGCQLYTAYPDMEYSPSTYYEKLVLGCDAGQARCEIMHDGTILGCALLDKDRWGGLNVFDLDYQTAWDKSMQLTNIRSLKNIDPACNSGSCCFDSFCNGGCPAHNERDYGDASAGGDQRCQIRSKIANSLDIKVVRSRKIPVVAGY